MRANLLAQLRDGRTFLPGILGYDETVLPQLENAILAGQDVILLGERGQAKSRIARSLVGLLDPWLPYLAGTELHDDPLHPVSPLARQILAEEGDAAPIGWWAAEDRYSEKLSTPDISIADLIGEVDPVKVAEGRYLSDELTIHYGLLPRTHRGIFSLNELPDLAERIQVGLLNVMEERDVQVRGYRVRLELDLFVIASANPEDYTSRGRIITPLKDRFGAQIRTHYPEESGTEMAIVDAEATAFETDDDRIHPGPGARLHEGGRRRAVAAGAPLVGGQSQRSGVSVRVTIANHETLAAAALKRAVRLGEPARGAADQRPAGGRGLDGGQDRARDARRRDARGPRGREARGSRGRQRLQPPLRAQRAGAAHRPLRGGGPPGRGRASSSRRAPTARWPTPCPSCASAVARLDAGESPAGIASAIEFVLEGLHLNRRLNKERRGGGIRYAR